MVTLQSNVDCGDAPCGSSIGAWHSSGQRVPLRSNPVAASCKGTATLTPPYSIDQLTEAMHVQQDIMWSNKPVAGGVLYGRLEDIIQAASPTAIMCDKASSALAALLGGGAYSQFVQWHSTIRVIRWLQRHVSTTCAALCFVLANLHSALPGSFHKAIQQQCTAVSTIKRVPTEDQPIAMLHV